MSSTSSTTTVVNGCECPVSVERDGWLGSIAPVREAQTAGCSCPGCYCGLGRLQGEAQSLPPVLFPVADVLDPREEARRELWAVVDRGDKRVEFGVVEVGEGVDCRVQR